MTDPSADPSERIAQAVTAHLERHPNARDTARGVRDWWLPSELRGVPVDKVERVLRRLVADGRLWAFVSNAGDTQFGRVAVGGEPRPESDPDPPRSFGV